MTTMRSILLILPGILAGGFVAIQSVLNSTLGQRVGTFGAILILTFISAVMVIILILLYPSTADFSKLPGLSEWYLYLGGIIGIAIVAAPILLVPKIGTTTTITAIILGQLLFALIIDQFGLFAAPKIIISFPRAIGVLLVAVGVLLVGR